MGKNKKNKVCDWLYVHTVINSNGRMSSCCSIWDEKYDFSSIGIKSNFKNMYNSDRFILARKFFSQKMLKIFNLSRNNMEFLGFFG